MTRYKFMLRPISSYHLPQGVAWSHQEPTTLREHSTPHGSVLLSRELTQDEMRRFDVYPLAWAGEDIARFRRAGD